MVCRVVRRREWLDELGLALVPDAATSAHENSFRYEWASFHFPKRSRLRRADADVWLLQTRTTRATVAAVLRSGGKEKARALLGMAQGPARRSAGPRPLLGQRTPGISDSL